MLAKAAAQFSTNEIDSDSVAVRSFLRYAQCEEIILLDRQETIAKCLEASSFNEQNAEAVLVGEILVLK